MRRRYRVPSVSWNSCRQTRCRQREHRRCSKLHHRRKPPPQRPRRYERFPLNWDSKPRQIPQKASFLRKGEGHTFSGLRLPACFRHVGRAKAPEPHQGIYNRNSTGQNPVGTGHSTGLGRKIGFIPGMARRLIGLTVRSRHIFLSYKDIPQNIHRIEIENQVSRRKCQQNRRGGRDIGVIQIEDIGNIEEMEGREAEKLR